MPLLVFLVTFSFKVILWALRGDIFSMIIPMIFCRVKQNLKVLVTPPGGDWPRTVGCPRVTSVSRCHGWMCSSLQWNQVHLIQLL